MKEAIKSPKVKEALPIEPQKKWLEKYKYLGLILVCVIIALSIGLIIILPTKPAVNPILKEPPKTSNNSLNNYKLPSQNITRTQSVKWTKTAEQIDPPTALNVFMHRRLASPFGQLGWTNVSEPTFYKIGLWKTGPFKDKELLAISYALSSPNSNEMYYFLFRVTLNNNQIIVIDDSNGGSSELDTLGIDKTNITLTGGNLITNLEDGGQESVNVDGKYINISPSRYSQIFAPDSNYTFLTNYKNGQKLYRKNQTGASMLWGNIENPYVGEDLDHVLIRIDTPDGEISGYDKKDSERKWLILPDPLTDLSKGAQSIGSLNYTSTYLGDACRFVPAEQLSQGTSFSPANLTLVMTDGNIKYYQPNNFDASQILHIMFSYLQKHISSNSAWTNFTYDRYVKSMPILIWQDNLNTYHILYRWGNYPGSEGGCGKPVIYLYPKAQTNIRVQFMNQMVFSKTEPTYGNAWNVNAQPNGMLTDLSSGKQYPYLYWEGASSQALPQKSADEGYMVRRENMKSFLLNTLGEYGLNSRETNDFIVYWLPKLQEKPFYKISFYTTAAVNQSIPLIITPKPDHLLRILMEYQGLDREQKTIPPAIPAPFQRDGFTVIEWGGIFSQ